MSIISLGHIAVMWPCLPLGVQALRLVDGICGLGRRQGGMSFAHVISSAAQGKVGPTASGMWICSNSGATNGAMPGCILWNTRGHLSCL